jgi:beta-carotene 3-hydroxylase
MSLYTLIICIGISIITFLFWEGVAWFTHKYIMHGILWTWHKSHHSVHDHTLEKNDWFAVVFSIPSIALFYYATIPTFNPYALACAIGILGYGIFYIVFHDIIVHQRIRWRIAYKSSYLKRMINAHYTHHRKHTKEGCEAFGFLYAPKKYAVTDLKLKKNRQETQ